MDLKTGYPFWLIKNGLPYDYPKLEQSINTEVLIIGGGISGALTAFHLIEKGIECVLVDKRTIALGSTSASTALLQYELDIPLCRLSEMIGYRSAVRAYQLCAEAIEDLQHIMQKIKFTEYSKCPSLYFAANKKDSDLIESEYEIRKKSGFLVELLTEQDIKDNYGFAAANAIRSTHGAGINPYQLTHQLLQYCIKKGLQVFDRTNIISKEYNDEGATLTTENNQVIQAKYIVNATGYEVTEFMNQSIVQLHSTYAIISEHADSSNFWKDGSMIWNTANPYLYMRLTSDHRILVGGRDEPFYDPAARDRLIKRKTKQLTADFNHLFPEINFIPEFSWTGTFGTTKDALPYIGRHPNFPHTYFALGFGGNGITFSVIAAEIIRDMIMGHENKEAPLFSFERN